MNIEEFYDADARRRSSAEVEFGQDWHDAGGNRYEVSWVADTGELYLMCEPTPPAVVDPFGDTLAEPGGLGEPIEGLGVKVLARVDTRDRVEEILAGWETAMAGENSTAWLAGKLEAAGFGRR